MNTVLNEDWTAEVAGRMHKYRITNTQLATECGITAAYLSTVLNGNKQLTDNAKDSIRERIFQALERLEGSILDSVQTELTEQSGGEE